MKRILILIIFILSLSCKEEPKQTETQQNKKTSLTKKVPEKKKIEIKKPTLAFLKNVKSLEKDTSKNPIERFKKDADNTVKKIIKLNKNNIEEALLKAKDFKYAIITVGDYTIVKITDLDNCKPSGSWKACMPKGEGYIKKGKLLYQNDYINNIIGLPDNQERLLYLF